jgi:multidrug transporter EmrE-like cation transporter
MIPKYLFLILVGLAVLLEVVADIFLKKWALQSKNVLLGIGLLLYFIGTVFWAYSLKYEYLSRAITFFAVLNVIAIMLVGVYLFGEKLTLASKMGMLLGVISLVLMEI